MSKIQSIQTKLEAKTRRWWFFVTLIALQVLILPFSSKGFYLEKTGEIIGYTLSHSLFFACVPAFPVFQVISIVVLILIPLLRNRIRLVLALHAGVSYVLFAILQNIAIAPKYGVSIVTINVVMFLLVAATWFLEAAVARNDLSPRKRSPWQFSAIPLAVLAFWLPINWRSGLPDFRLVHFLTSGSALAFCTMTPVYLALLILFYPRVNHLTLRVTSTVGVILGLYNVIPKLVLQIHSSWWDGVLHLPLLLLSAAGVALSMRRTETSGHNKPDAGDGL